MMFIHVEIDDFLLIWNFGGKIQKAPRTCITDTMLDGRLPITLTYHIKISYRRFC